MASPYPSQRHYHTANGGMQEKIILASRRTRESLPARGRFFLAEVLAQEGHDAPFQPIRRPSRQGAAYKPDVAAGLGQF